MGKKSPPEPPDPMEVAEGQTSTNIGTAIANSYLNNYTQKGPGGSLTYDIVGETSYKDPLTGRTYQLPKWEQNTTLSPGQQKLYDLNQGTGIEMAGMAGEQAKKVRSLLNAPVDLSNEATEARLFELGNARYEPQKAQELESLRTRLANQGVTEGSDAYSNSMGDFNEGWNDRYNQLLLSGRGQAVQEALQERNQPLNEIIGIMSGTQVGLPSFAGQANQYGIPTTDYAGISMDAARMEQQAWAQQQQANASMFGSLFGGLGSLVSLSDENAKENIEKVGETNDGQNIYTYNYKGDAKPQMGLIAQEVEKKHPDAVVRDPVSGFRLVHYGKALADAAKKGRAA